MADLSPYCTDCGRPLRRRGLVPRSRATGQEHRCVACAWRHGYAYTPPPPPTPLPRYCTCRTYHRTNDLPEQCACCYRRIHPVYDHEISR